MITAETENEQTARKIRELINKRGSSEAHVIAALGMHHKTFAVRMSGGKSFTLSEIRTIAKALGASVWDLVPDTWLGEMEAAA